MDFRFYKEPITPTVVRIQDVILASLVEKRDYLLEIICCSRIELYIVE